VALEWKGGTVHELSIAQAIVDVVEEETRNAGASRVVSITLALGELSGVVEEQLRFCFPLVVKDTALDGVELTIETVRGEGFCEKCHDTFAMPSLLTPCPRCGEYTQEIRAGQELVVASLEVE
jgi:hydrogenase nickel incorporation protein HypA/HybF